MTAARRKRIGFLINQTVSGYTVELCRGAKEAAMEENADLYIFSGALATTPKESDLDKTALQRNVLYEYSLQLDLDALVVAYDGVKQSSEPSVFEHFLEEAKSRRLIYMEATVPGVRCIQADQVSTLRGLIEHLILEHGCRRIGCLRGPVGSPDADIRFRVYEEVLREHGLVFVEDYVETGNFLEESGENIRPLLRRHPELDAVVCCNDLVAIRAQEVLAEMGWVPGKDIAVIGCDNIEASKRAKPPLTTIEMDEERVGYYGVKEAVRLVDDEPQKIRAVSCHAVYRQSCGCSREEDMNLDQAERHHWEHAVCCYEKQLTKYSVDALLAATLADAAVGQQRVNGEVLRKVATALREMGICNAVLLLFPTPIPVQNQEGWFICASEARPVLRLCSGEAVIRDPEAVPCIPISSLLQNVYGYGGAPRTRSVFVLQCEKEQFGLLICRENLESMATLYMACYQLGSMLKFISLQEQHYELEKKLHGAVRTITEKNTILQRLSHYDALTQIYNRRGLLEAMRTAQTRHAGQNAALLFLDLNSLKQINDLFGHSAGDFAISSFAKVLKETLRSDDIIGRFGGDEFMALLVGVNAGIENEVRERLRNAFRRFNAQSDRPFYVEASLGVYTFRIDSNTNLEALFDSADQFLYEDKQKKRRDVRKLSNAG